MAGKVRPQQIVLKVEIHMIITGPAQRKNNYRTPTVICSQNRKG